MAFVRNGGGSEISTDTSWQRVPTIELYMHKYTCIYFLYLVPKPPSRNSAGTLRFEKHTKMASHGGIILPFKRCSVNGALAATGGQKVIPEWLLLNNLNFNRRKHPLNCSTLRQLWDLCRMQPENGWPTEETMVSLLLKPRQRRCWADCAERILAVSTPDNFLSSRDPTDRAFVIMTIIMQYYGHHHGYSRVSAQPSLEVRHGRLPGQRSGELPWAEEAPGGGGGGRPWRRQSPIINRCS